MKFTTYLYFNGNCREAFEFYQSVFGGVIPMMMTYRDAPPDMPVDPGSKDLVMHTRLEIDGGAILGSDAPPDRYAEPHGFSTTIHVDTPEEAEKLYAGLSAGGDIFMPLAETFFATKYAMFSDKFGIPWMIICEKPMG